MFENQGKEACYIKKKGAAEAAPMLIVCVLLKLLEFNNGTTVEVEWLDVVNTTLVNLLDLACRNAELDELISNHVSTTLRESLVDFRSTSVRVGRTSNDNLVAISLSYVSNSLEVHNVLLRLDLCRVLVEEYRSSSRTDHAGWRCWRSWSVLKLLDSLLEASDLSLQTSVLLTELVEFSLELIDTSLLSSEESVNLCLRVSLVPVSLAKVDTYTEFSGEDTVVLSRVSSSWSSLTPLTSSKCVSSPSVSEIEVDVSALAKLPSVLDTSAESWSVLTDVECTEETSTSKRNEVPNTVLVVTTDDVAEVDQSVSRNSTVATAVLSRHPLEGLVTIVEWYSTVLVVLVIRVDQTILPLYLSTESDLRREPLTNSEVYTERFSVRENFLKPILSVLWVLERHVNAHLNKPVAPERIECYSVLCVYCSSSKASKSQRNHKLFHKHFFE